LSPPRAASRCPFHLSERIQRRKFAEAQTDNDSRDESASGQHASNPLAQAEAPQHWKSFLPTGIQLLCSSTTASVTGWK
jgi:hypothetical protein